ncbi:ThiF family adenylyltransferase [Planctomycetota bacterium]|nr:ThiF family adenylyltransferase [Planctomycetota bacterium]
MNLQRYHRQMLLPDIGEQGQKLISSSTALVVGCGALGCMIASMLVRAGIGKIILVDRDFVDLTNLQRQVLFNEDDVNAGLPKAIAAKEKLSRINANVEIQAEVADINFMNIETYLKDCDIVIDGVDNFETRYIVNDAAIKHAIPYVYGGAVGTTGTIYPILPHTKDQSASWETEPETSIAGPCLRCIHENMPAPGSTPTCDTAGVLGPIVSIIANLQVTEAIKILTKNWSKVSRSMQFIDLWQNQFKQFDIASLYEAGDCVCCKQHNYEFLDGIHGSRTTTMCGREAVQILPTEGQWNLNLEQLKQKLESTLTLTKANPFMLQLDIKEAENTYELTIFKDGRAMVRGTRDENIAKSIYAKYIGS